MINLLWIQIFPASPPAVCSLLYIKNRLIKIKLSHHHPAVIVWVILENYRDYIRILKLHLR